MVKHSEKRSAYVRSNIPAPLAIDIIEDDARFPKFAAKIDVT